jgi:hypothetical protein
MPDDKEPLDTKEMLVRVIFKVVDDLILFKQFRRELFAARAKAKKAEEEQA